jgi:hypothetical protein
MKRLILLAALLLSPAAATASTCCAYSYVLTNGQTADANQVMSNFNSILNCANNFLAPSSALVGLAPLASPNFTGVPTTTTATAGDASSQVASDSFVSTAVSNALATAAATYAPLASPVLTGTPTAPTAAPATSTTQIATTAFVGAAVAAAAPPTATTSVNGLTTLATGAQVVTGTDTTHAVTPASLTSAQSLAANGYTQLPGGLYIEWGTSSSVSANSSTGGGVAFPHACASAVYSVVLTPAQSMGTGGMAYAYTFGQSTSGFTIFNAAPNAGGFYWQAICK